MYREIYRSFLGDDKRKIGEGADSVVYSHKEWAIKIYNVRGGVRLGKEQVMLYKNITDRAIKELLRLEYKCFLNDAGYQVLINPINAMIFDRNDRQYVNICPLIEGPTLESLVEEGRQDICVPSVRDRFWRQEFVKPEAELGLSDLSFKLQKSLKMPGIDIITRNVKVLNRSFIVTDLCPSIEELGVYNAW